MTHLRLEPLEDRLAPVTLPPGFTESVFAAGLTAPTAMAVVPDGRVLVAEKAGTLRVVENGAVLPTPFLSLDVNTFSERGLIGVAVDPNFAANGFVYVYHTVDAPTPFNRISRFTASGNVAAPGSQVVLLDVGPSTNGNHNGGALQFGADGKLYVGVGESGVPANSQDPGNLLGKVLRLNPDGSVPPDNPFVGVPGARGEIWALGLRNPFTLAVQPGTGRLFINDVGSSQFEEINDGQAGANYGWPATEGDFDPAAFPGFTRPVHAYPRGLGSPDVGRAIIGGAFYNPEVFAFPAEFAGDYFFSDLLGGWINRRDAATGAVTNFANDLTGEGVVDADLGPGGQLLYLASGPQGAIYQITFAPPQQPPGDPRAPAVAIGSGAGGPGVAKLVDAAGGTLGEVVPFGGVFAGGVRVATGDVTGDGNPDLIAAAGPGGSPRVVVFDRTTGAAVRTFFAFEESFAGGVFVAAADFDGDGFDDIAVSPDVGGGPRVQVFSGRDGSVLASFFGIDDPNFRGGARVAAGDLNADGTPDLAVAAGTGGGPRVAVFDGRTVRPGVAPARLFADFFAFEDTLRDGVFLAVGGVDADATGDLVVGAGPGGAPRVLVLSGSALPAAGVAGATLASFFSGDPAARNGVPVAARDLLGDARAEVVAGTAGGSEPRVRLYDVGAAATEVGSFLALDPAFTGGVFVG